LAGGGVSANATDETKVDATVETKTKVKSKATETVVIKGMITKERPLESGPS